MPKVNQETLVYVYPGGSYDNKIVYETLATTEGEPDDHLHTAEKNGQEENPPDFPPESFWLSKDAELDWFDRNAVYERVAERKLSFQLHKS